MKTASLYLLSLCLCISCTQKPDKEALKSVIENANKEWMDGVAKKDADAVAAMYTEDAKLMPPNAPAMTGRAGAKDLISGALNSGVSAIRLTTEDVNGTDDMAIENGKYEIMVGENMVVDEGKYLVEWKKVNGKWLLHKDIFNSNMPAARTSARKDQPVAIAIYKVKKGKAFENFARNILMPATDRSTPEKDQAMRAVRLLSPGSVEKDGTLRYIWIFDPYAVDGQYDIEAILIAKHGEQKGKQLMKEFADITSGYEFYSMKQTDI